MPELNGACTACEIVVSRKTIAALWSSQHTNFVLKKMLCSKAKTRRLSDGCSGILRKANPQVCRAGGLQPKEMVCQRHFDKIRREDDRRCSCPSAWGHSSRLHGHAIPHHFFPTLDHAGFNFPNYQPGTRWCNKCRSEAPQRIQNWPKSDKSENIATSQQDHTQVSFLNMFIFCRMLFEENLE